MNYFNKYYSNSIAGSANRLSCDYTDGKVCARIFYRLTEGGTYDYSLIFSNINDSTYDAGVEGYKNKIYGEWIIHSMRLAVCPRDLFPVPFGPEGVHVPLDCDRMGELIPVTFNGSAVKHVAPGEFFTTDPVTLTAGKGEYLCVEITYEGKDVPAYDEWLIPVYVLRGGEWMLDKKVPVPGMIGATLAKKPRVAFIGDSITCGCGTAPNAYENWSALVAEKLGDAYACHNLGIGYGRAEDFASGGAWFYKAKHNDFAVVCFGVNDILQGRSEDNIISDITSCVRRLKGAGVRVLLQTVPPFDYAEELRGMWERINNYIKTELALEVDGVFDNVPFLCADAEHPYAAKYEGHPNREGCIVWAENLYARLKKLLENC